MKGAVATESYHGKNKLNFIQWLVFSLAWFGMRPVLFEKFPSSTLPYRGYVWRGLSRILIGLLLLYILFLFDQHNFKIFFLPELILLVGLSLLLHFGILNLATALWRSLGVDVKELFRSPYKSKSLKEFWGKRRNIAFSEMMALVAYRPLKKKVGASTAMLLSFLLSGLLHEIAISFPVNSGYGLPLLYFAIHGILMYGEDKSLFIKKIISNKILSHAWVLGWLILPMPLLFHSKFIDAILKPLRDGFLDVFLNYHF